MPTETVDGCCGASQRGASRTASRTAAPDGSVTSTPLGGDDSLPAPRFPGAHQLLHQISKPTARPCGTERAEYGGRGEADAAFSPVSGVSRTFTFAAGPPTKRTRALPSSEHGAPSFVKLTQPTSEPVAPLKKTPRCGSTVAT